MKIQAVRGFKDWLPEEFAKYQYLIELAKNILKTYNYKEIKIPILEKTQLFVRSIGEFTDIVQKETYTFQDRNKEFLTLRPEATAGICRMFIEKGLFVSPKPIKFFTIGPMFRHERPQKGRLREFYQINAELFSELNPYLETEIIFLALEILKKPLILEGIDAEIYTLEINSLGCPNCRPSYKKVLLEFLRGRKEELCETCKERLERNPLRILDCKNENCKNVIAKAPTINEFLCKDCKTHFETIKDLLNSLGIKFVENPYLVRGLDYYVRTIFEIKAKELLGAQDTVAAGGRYDYLLEELGGKHLPAMGFAIGVERWAISIFGDEKNKGLISSQKVLKNLNPDVFVIVLDKKHLIDGFKLTNFLRKEDIKCEINYEEKSLKAQLKNADKLCARYALILGEDEWQKKEAILKNMEKGKQEYIKFETIEDLAQKVANKIKNGI